MEIALLFILIEIIVVWRYMNKVIYGFSSQGFPYIILGEKNAQNAWKEWQENFKKCPRYLQKIISYWRYFTCLFVSHLYMNKIVVFSGPSILHSGNTIQGIKGVLCQRCCFLREVQIPDNSTFRKAIDLAHNELFKIKVYADELQ